MLTDEEILRYQYREARQIVAGLSTDRDSALKVLEMARDLVIRFDEVLAAREAQTEGE